MFTIKIDNDEYRLPQEWDELTERQLRFLARQTTGNVPVEQLKIYMMLYCLGARVQRDSRIWGNAIFRRVGTESTHVTLRIGLRKKYRLLPEEVLSLSRLMEFLLQADKPSQKPGYRYFRQEQPAYHLHPSLTRNPYPVLHVRLRRFTASEDGLFSLTFGQYMYLQTYLDGLQNGNSTLEQVLACLWHRGHQFDIDRLESDARLLRHLPADRKMVMYWFIAGSIEELACAFPRLFSAAPASGRRSNTFDQQLRLLDSLAGSDMTKKDAVRNGNLLDALYAMDESVRKQEELEGRMNS